MSEFKFVLDQVDADDFALEVEDGFGCTWRIPMRTPDAVALWVAVDKSIGDYVREMRAAKAEFESNRAFDADRMTEAFNAYDPDDPKHPTYHDRLASIWDDRDKTVRP